MARSDVLDEATAVRESARVVAAPEEITDAIERMARWISDTVGTSCPTVLAVMRGGAFTATRVCSRVRVPYRFDYVHGTRYGDEVTGGKLSWPVPPSPNLAGETVVIVDDILDRGVTLADLYARLEAIGAARILSAVLVSKDVEMPKERPRPDFVGLRIDDHYVFGCGMDYKGFWRGLPALYAVDDT
ncbi:MAG TPA: hypoxanthine-guanine phosphoribosyltransferase [Gammaproteobacteria bacterium]